MKKIVLLITFALLLQSSLTADTLETVKIMPLGDSITFDDAYNPKPDRLKAAYRSFLWYKLKENHYQVDFVGRQKTGWDLRPEFDGDNEGYPGWTSGDLYSSVYGFLISNPPDIVLLMAGANDWSDSVNGINGILNEIDRYESNYHHHIKVIVARIPNRQSYQRWMSDLNRNIQTLVDRRIRNGDDLYVIDLENGAGINYNNDFQDPTHPNDVAYEKMANVWYTALTRFIKPKKNYAWLPAVYSVLLQ